MFLKDMLDRYRRGHKGKRGFTLVELLITITITGVITITAVTIIISSMNTFKRQQVVMDSLNVKEVLLLNVKSYVRKKEKMLLTSTVTKGPESEIVIDKDNAFLTDVKLKEYHMLFSDEGRIYKVASNLKGRLNLDATATKPGEAVDEIYGKMPVFDEQIYKGYNVEIGFIPLLSVSTGKYQDLQIKIDIVNPKDANDKLTGYETIKLLNVANKKNEISFRDENGLPTSTPLTTPYKYCYYA